MSKRVRTLLRVSSKQQLYDDDIPLQRAEAKRYIDKRPDWIFDREYIEKAVSAYKNSVEEREVLQKIMADAREHRFDVLLTYMSDRIGRQEEYSFYVAALNGLGIEVWTIKDGQLKTEDHIDKLLNYIRFWQNEGESKKTGMRVKDTQRELVRSGKFVGGRAPYGYRLVPSGTISNHGRLLKKLEIVEENAEVVKKIYALAVRQGMGYEKIAKELNRQGIPAITTDKWKAGTIRSILTNPVYMGYYALNRRENHGGYVRLDRRDWIYSDEQIQELVIISRPTWEKAQEIREARKYKIGIARENSSRQYEVQHHVPFTTSGRLALIGLVYCGYCGKRLKNGSYCNHWTTKDGEKKTSFYGRYICTEKCAKRSCYSQDYLEGIVFEAAENHMQHLGDIDILGELRRMQEQEERSIRKESDFIQKQQKALKKDIATLEEKIPEALRGDYYFSAEKLSEMISEKERSYKELDRHARQTGRRMEQAVLRKNDMEKMDIMPDWKEEFLDMDTAVKKMLLSDLIDRIEVRDGDINIKFRIRPERLYETY